MHVGIVCGGSVAVVVLGGEAAQLAVDAAAPVVAAVAALQARRAQRAPPAPAAQPRAPARGAAQAGVALSVQCIHHSFTLTCCTNRVSFYSKKILDRVIGVDRRYKT